MVQLARPGAAIRQCHWRRLLCPTGRFVPYRGTVLELREKE
jgi:hypothetical protein